MYTGTLIEELMAAVERAEYRARAEQEPAELERLYPAPPQEMLTCEPDGVGVA